MNLLSFKQRREFKRKNIIVWQPTNVYKTAHILGNVSIGRFSEIGNNVFIGSGVRIGKGVFVPEGVFIGNNVFIGPHVCFSNDMYPPSRKEDWQPTKVYNGASIGAGAKIRPGVNIGGGALIGMGSVVVCDIPDNEIWAGCPAKFIRKRD